MDNTDGGECIGTGLTKLIKVITGHLDKNASLNKKNNQIVNHEKNVHC